VEKALTMKKPASQNFDWRTWHALPKEQLLRELKASKQGLESQEAQKRLKASGPNEPVTLQQRAALLQLLRLFLNPLVLLLLFASLVSAILGDPINASIITTMVLLGVGLNFAQTSTSQRAVEHLREGVAPTATVLRDGTWKQLPRRLLVPGDIVQLCAGDLIPADARLLEATDLHVQQAALTGESLPIEKAASDQIPSTEPLLQASNCVFLGTSVVSGTAQALIVATGHQTAFGDIAERLTRRAPETEFERGIKHFSFLILQTVFFLVLFVFFIGVVLHHPLFESMLFAIALAVGLTPEFLPMITTVTLGQGARRMAKQKVIVKHLEAMQNFGSIDILCSDKTGTLTSGMLALSQHVDIEGNSSERVLLLASLNSLFETGIRSPLDTAILEHAGPKNGRIFESRRNSF
jgi:Mg2+-importing ATPase